MMQTIIKTATLSVTAYFVALIVSRILGRKLISQMTFFDFVLGIALGSAAVNASLVQQNTNLSGFVIIIVISLLTIIIDFAHIKSFRLRKAVVSEPLAVVENGKIADGNMKRIRLSTEELMMKLREKNVFNIADVEFAILEADGQLSVQPKSQKQPLTPSDLNIPTSYKGLTRDLIIDGKVIQDNLSYINLNEEWLTSQIKDYGVQDIKDVFYAGIDTSGNLYVSKRQAHSEGPGKYGIE